MGKKYIKINPTYREIYKSEKLKKWENERPPKYWEYRRKWSENPKKGIVGNFPIHLDLESTRRCNLLCPMCPRTLKIQRGEKVEEGDMDFKLYKKVVDEGSENGLYSIKLSYLGEPLLCKDLPKMVKYAKDTGIIDVMFNTNAVPLTERISKKLIKAGLDKIFISFDSPIKERYESIRVGAKFERVIENVKTLARLRDELGTINPLIRVSMVKMKENAHEVPQFVKLWAPVVDIVATVDYANPAGLDKDAKERYAVHLKEHPNFVCPQLYQRLFVHYNGKVGLCCSDYDAELNLGNAWSDSIQSIWLGEKMKRIRELHNKGRWKEIPLCARCSDPYI